MRSARDFADFDRAGRETGVALFFCGLAGADLRTGAVFLLLAVVLVARVPAFRAGVLLALFFAGLPLEEAATFDFVALRAGAFSAAERLVIGFGRAVDLLPNVRPFPEEVEEV